MINNYEQIKSMLDYTDPNDYYFLQVLKRRKDNPDLERDMIHLNDYYIFEGEFERKANLAKKLCIAENARAYFRVNKRNSKKTALEALKLTATYIASGDYKSVRNSFARAAGQHHSDTEKKWIVDLDYIIYNEVEEHIVFKTIRNLVGETNREFKYEIIPTKNGSHLICPPFNSKKFHSIHGAIDLHKDNPTILFSI